MENATDQPTSLFSNRCPKCGETPIFRGISSMNKKCEACGNVYEKESGYFVGAMMAAYFLGAFLIVPVLGACLFLLDWSLVASLIAAGVMLLVLQPFLFRYSRLIWINIEHKLSQRV